MGLSRPEPSSGTRQRMELALCQGLRVDRFPMLNDVILGFRTSKIFVTMFDFINGFLREPIVFY